MAERNHSHRLNAEHKEFVCRMLAEFASLTEIMDALRERHGIELANHHAIQHYRDSAKWRPVVEKMREALFFNINRLPIASKFWRIKQLQDLYMSENRYRTVRYTKTGDHDYSPIEEIPLGELRNLLRQAAEELGELKQHIVAEHSDGVYTAEFPDGSPLHPAPAPGLPN